MTCVIALTALLSLPTSAAEADKLEDVSRNLDIFNSLFKELYINYVDTIPVEKIVTAGINGMLKKLDPYTTYIPEDKDNDFKLMTMGEYGGIGALIGVRGDSIVVSQIYSGRPAQKSGLKAGDVILSIDGKDMIKKKPSDASTALKGMPGTNTTVKVLIEYSSFYGKSADEVKQALLDLKKQGAKAIILDLRDNTGGIITEAINICNFFLPKGKTIVTTKGKGGKIKEVYKTAYQPIDTDIPLLVLVNGSSASASEIVSGALQDEDRAVIMGERTYGKGLVQTTAQLPYGGQLKVTIAKYYTPSGRCIQEINYTTKDGEQSKEIPDSLTHEFKTRGGRIVRDGRGIKPDVELKSDTGKVITYNLLVENMFANWATRYAASHKSIAPATEFEISDAEYNDFKLYVLDSKFTYKVSTKELLDDCIKGAKFEGVYERNKALFDSLSVALNHDVASEMDSAKTEICKALAQEIIGRYYYETGMAAYAVKHDKEIKQAIDLINDKERFNKIIK